ncbi:MAG TPA: RsmB/NOP family class I SAM-dependent RNA methyltransferase [Caulobacteraceae bacterium]|nr:RsmB/NOP family class I SAM-dependent RNA methyltransferase [Caulobacteraceae bacterium]
MRDGGRISAAIELIEEILGRGRPARLALKAWGDGARYAGAKDRAFVSGLTLDALRRRRSIAWRMDDESSRALALGVLRLAWGWEAARLVQALEEPHGPGPATEAERSRLEAPRDLADAPTPVRGDYADWMDPYLERVFGETRAAEGAALAERAPIDLRVNTLRADAAKTNRALAPLGVAPAPYLDTALRVAAPDAAERGAPVEAAPEFEKGWFEVQDLGSQLAAACAGDLAGRQVLDFCAGGGGKTLALAAAMNNTGQIFAYDADARRLTDTVRRGRRAGVRNLQVRSPLHPEPLAGLEDRMDLVFIDAPCTGSGTWRRHPDTKWRLRKEQLERRMAEQDEVLASAARFVRPGGRLLYATCSLFAEENEDRLDLFLSRFPAFNAVSVELPASAPQASTGRLRLTPLSHGTDGFFVAVLQRGA